METLIYLLKFCICCFLVFAANWFAGLLIFEWGRRDFAREDEYNEKYRRIKFLIGKAINTSHNYDIIFRELNELKEMKHKDRKKTRDLTNSFNWKYRTIAKQRARKPEAVFKS